MSTQPGPPEAVGTGPELPSLLAVAVLARLRTPLSDGARLGVHDGEPVEVEVDGDGRVHPYVALYDSPGTLGASTLAVPATGPDELTWTFQTTCAGGDPDRCRRAVARVRALLAEQPLLVPSPTSPSGTRVAGWCTETPSYDPGPARIDRDVQPPRWYVPLLWTVTAAA